MSVVGVMNEEQLHAVTENLSLYQAFNLSKYSI